MNSPRSTIPQGEVLIIGTGGQIVLKLSASIGSTNPFQWRGLRYNPAGVTESDQKAVNPHGGSFGRFAAMRSKRGERQKLAR